MDRRVSLIIVALLVGLLVGSSVGNGRAVTTPGTRDARVSASLDALDTQFSSHHLEQHFTLPPGGSQQLTLPGKGAPVQINASVSNIVIGGTPMPPLVLSALVARDMRTGQLGLGFGEGKPDFQFCVQDFPDSGFKTIACREAGNGELGAVLAILPADNTLWIKLPVGVGFAPFVNSASLTVALSMWY